MGLGILSPAFLHNPYLLSSSTIATEYMADSWGFGSIAAPVRTLLPSTLLLTCKCNTWSVNYFPKFLIVLVVLASLWVVVVGERIAGVYAGWRIEGCWSGGMARVDL